MPIPRTVDAYEQLAERAESYAAHLRRQLQSMRLRCERNPLAPEVTPLAVLRDRHAQAAHGLECARTTVEVIRLQARTSLRRARLAYRVAEVEIARLQLALVATQLERAERTAFARAA